MTLKDAVQLLEASGIDSPQNDARLIFSKIGGFPAERLVFENPTATPEIEDAVKRRCAREPLQYIIGYTDFYRESYRVTPSCLIPRQETELLVDYAVKHIPKGEHFIDVCTGSGCIAISVLKNTDSTRATAVDISADALAVAEENARINSVSDRLRFINADALKEPHCGKIYAVLSNPPYVKTSVYSELEPEIKHEPSIAFLGGEDGADFYRRITELYKPHLKKDGFILFEIGFDQGDILLNIAKKNGMSARIIKDYSSLPRLALLTFPI